MICCKNCRHVFASEKVAMEELNQEHGCWNCGGHEPDNATAEEVRRHRTEQAKRNMRQVVSKDDRGNVKDVISEPMALEKAKRLLRDNPYLANNRKCHGWEVYWGEVKLS